MPTSLRSLSSKFFLRSRRFNASMHSNRSLRKRRSFGRELRLEPLESRVVLTAYIVNTLDDTSTAPDGLISLREALTAANSNAAFRDAPAGQLGPGVTDTISFDPSLNGQEINLGPLGAFLITDAVSIFDNNLLPISLDAENVSRLFEIPAGVAGVSIANVVLQNGQASTGGAILVGLNANVSLDQIVVLNSAANDGGGLYNDGGTVAINRASFSGNRANAASGSGGALFSASGSVTIVESQFNFNRATRAGGAIEVGDGSVSLTRTNFINNDVNGLAGPANPGNGGALHTTGVSTVVVDGGLFVGNRAAREGGALWNSLGGTLTVIGDARFLQNIARGPAADDGGGAIFNNGGTVHIGSSGSVVQIQNNSATGAAGSGGGIFTLGGTLTVANADISGNRANRAGGGIEATAGSTTTVVNSRLNGNFTGTPAPLVASPGNGGGLHITGNGNATFTGGEVSHNLAANEGGGLWNGTGTLTVTGTLISGNTASGALATNGGGGIFNLGGTVNVTNATLSANRANGTSGSGGGLFSTLGAVTLNAVNFQDNSANRAGGAIEIVAGALNMNFTNLARNNVNGGAGVPAPGNGGGVHVTGAATTTIVGGTFSGNTAAREGGGLWNSAAGQMTLSNNVVLVNNFAHGAAAEQGGGAIFNNGGTITIDNATIVANAADGASGSGGGLFNFGGTLVVNNSLVGFNSANRAGGGIEVKGGTTQLNGVNLSNNRALSAPGNGGGLHTTDAGNVVIVGSQVNFNFAGAEGGGLWNSPTGTLSVRDTTIGFNNAPLGGGVFNKGTGGTVTITTSTIARNNASVAGGGLMSEGGTVTVQTSTISSNSTQGSGGGIQQLSGTVNLQSVTVAANLASASGGGANQVGGTLNAVNTLFGLNTAATGPDVAGTLTSGGNNLVSNAAGATIVGSTSGNIIGVNPNIGPLLNNGGLTQTHALQPGSLAINAGVTTGLATDQRGTARPQGAAADIGAFEVFVPNSLRATSLQAADVSRNSIVTALDVLLVVNRLNERHGEGETRAVAHDDPLDVNGDGYVTPLDALLIINILNGSQGQLVTVDSAPSTMGNVENLAVGHEAVVDYLSAIEEMSSGQDEDEVLLSLDDIQIESLVSLLADEMTRRRQVG